MKQILYFFILINIVSACSEKAEIPYNAIDLKSIESSRTDFCPSWMVGDIAISMHYRGRNYVGQVIENNTWKKADNIFHIGHGHNEFNVISLCRGQENSLLLLNSPFRGNKLLSLTAVEKANNITEISNVKTWKKYDLSNLPTFKCTSQWMVSLSDSTILVLGAPFNAIGHIFSVIDYKHQTVLPLEYWPEDGVKCDSLIKNEVYDDNAKLFSNGNGRYFYENDAERFSFVFSIDKNKINIVKNLYSIFPRYEVSDFSKENFQYIHHNNPEKMESWANNKFIYTLLTECDKEGNKLDEWNGSNIYGNIVEVYDWNGNKKNTLHLDKYGGRIMVSEDNKVLYLFEERYAESQVIWSYDIASLK